MARPLSSILLPLIFLFPMVASSQANIGTEPALTFGARNIFTDFGVPRPKDRDTDEIYRSARDLQMITRARRLGINESSATEAWKQSGATFTRAQHFAERPAATAAVVFHGSDSAGLNALIARRDVKAIRLSSPHLDLTGPLIVRRNDLEIDLGEAHIRLNGPAPFMIRIEAASNIRLHGGVFDSGPGAIVIQHSRAVLVANAQITGIHGGGVLVTDSRECVVWRNQFHRVGGAPVMLHGDTVGSVIAGNNISTATRTSRLIPTACSILTCMAFVKTPS